MLIARVLMYSDLARMGLEGKRVMECKRGTVFLNHSKQPSFSPTCLVGVCGGVGGGGCVCALFICVFFVGVFYYLFIFHS